MRPIFTSCVLALSAAVTLGAQNTTIKTETRIKADDAKVMTIAGCLSGGPSAFIVTNASAVSNPAEKNADANKTLGTSGVVDSYALVPRAGVALASHVGHRVELVGLVVAAATRGDDDAKIEIRERTEVKRENAPDSKTETITRAQIARGPSAQFAVTSVKMISPVCIE